MTIVPSQSELESALCLSNDLINKDYLNHLDELPIICPVPLTGTIKFLKILSFKLDTDITLLNYFAFVLDALHSLGISFSYILRVTTTAITPYFAISYTYHSSAALKILEEGLLKTYPDIQIEWLHTPDFDWYGITSISSVALIPKENNISSMVSSLDPLISLMKGEEYLIMFLATSISRDTYKCELSKLQSLYTTLYPFKDRSYSDAHHCHHTTTDSTTFTHTDTEGTTHTTSTGTSTGNTTSHSVGDNISLNYRASDTLTFNSSINHNDVCTQNLGSSDNASDANSNQLSHTKSVVDTDTRLTIDSSTIGYRLINSRITTLLSLADTELARYAATINLSVFNFSTYFLSRSVSTSVRAASTYSGLIADTTIYPNFINTWTLSNDSFSYLLGYLSHIQVPMFCNPSDNLPVSSGLDITSKELNPLLSPIIFHQSPVDNSHSDTSLPSLPLDITSSKSPPLTPIIDSSELLTSTSNSLTSEDAPTKS